MRVIAKIDERGAAFVRLARQGEQRLEFQSRRLIGVAGVILNPRELGAAHRLLVFDPSRFTRPAMPSVRHLLVGRRDSV